MLSVIVPYRNAARYLPDAILPFRSVLKDGEIELILVDSGSEDGSTDLLKRYVAEGLPLKLTATEAHGPGSARNKGISEASGKYLAFLDADDQVLPERLVDLCTRMAENDADMAIFNHQRLYPSGELKINQRSDLLASLPAADSELAKLPLLDNFNVAWNKVYRRSFIAENGLQFPEGIYEDIPWSVSCLFSANRVITSSEVLYTYRQHSLSTLKTTGEAHLALPEQYQRAIDYCRKQECSLSWHHSLVDRCAEHVLLVAYKRRRVSKELRAALFKGLVDLISANGAEHVIQGSSRVGELQKWALRLGRVEVLEADRAVRKAVSFAKKRLGI